MTKQSKSGWDENGIYREYGEDGTLLLEQTSYGSVNPTCEVGKRMISGMIGASFTVVRGDGRSIVRSIRPIKSDA